MNNDKEMTVPDNSASKAIIAGEIYSLGMSLLQMNKAREATFQFRKAFSMAPGYSDAALALGHCLHLQGIYAEALSVYDSLLTESPGMVAAWNNRGTTLLEMCCYAEAADSYIRALELAPALHDARVALATCYQAQGRVKEALSACETVLAVAPQHAEAHWNRSLLLLLRGDYQEGWREYEWRWSKRNFTSPHRHFSQPRWQGEPATGKTILIHAEQGFGDTVQFCRFIPLVIERGMQVVFECHPPLLALMKSLAGDVHVVPMGQPLPPFDLHLPLLSLPLIFGTTLETIPADVPYLAPPSDRLPYWRSQIIDNREYRVGLCWAGKAYPDPARSCPTRLLASLAEREGVSWYSLQVGWEKTLPFPMIDCTNHVRDFGDTAALIAQLDLVITVDTAVAHLAGALGKECWVMLTAAPDWRWMLGRENAPWYPSMKLYRQNGPDSWQYVIHRVGNTLMDAAARTCRIS